jgi:hypothetical protein
LIDKSIANLQQVQLAAVEAFSSFFRSVQRKAQQKYFQLIPDILNILPPLKDGGNSDHLTRAFLALIDLAEVAPKMFKPLFNNLLTFSITVIQDKELTDQTRQNALELMATFAEQSPALCKKDPAYTNEMVTQCLSLMTDVGIDDDDASEWNASEDVSKKQHTSIVLFDIRLVPLSSGSLLYQARLPRNSGRV